MAPVTIVASEAISWVVPASSTKIVVSAAADPAKVNATEPRRKKVLGVEGNFIEMGLCFVCRS